jgi:Glycosyl transferase family 2
LLLEEGGNYGDVVAVRCDVLHAVLARLLAGSVDSLSTGTLLRCAREWGSVGHIPRVLSSRQQPASEGAADSVVPQVPRCSSTGGLHRIRIVVPTRNQRALLNKCIESLQAKAQHPDRIEFVIIDNGSNDPDTLSYLAALQERDQISVMRDERPFNWSLLNNTGV